MKLLSLKWTFYMNHKLPSKLAESLIDSSLQYFGHTTLFLDDCLQFRGFFVSQEVSVSD